MIKDLESQKLSASRVEPYLAQYKLNCRVNGLPEIDQMLETVEKSKTQLKELEQFLESNKETESIETLNKIKDMYNEIELDFEEKEDDINIMMWNIEVKILQKQPEYKVDVDDYRGLDQEFTKLKIKNEWFSQFRLVVNEILKRVRKC
jgi:hypothetical protein